MKRLGWLVLIATFVALTASAQGSAGTQNSITSMLKQQVVLYGKVQVMAAELMPADKYSYKPTPDVRSFGELTLHIAMFNNEMCARLTTAAPPNTSGLKGSTSKEELVTALKVSFDYCTKAIGALDDSTLGQPAGGRFFGDLDLTRGTTLLILGEDWYVHYGTQALYLRLNGILPPSGLIMSASGFFYFRGRLGGDMPPSASGPTTSSH